MARPTRRGRRPPATWPAGTTVVAGVIGDPITHSLSPALHNAAFRALGLDWVYVAFPVPPGRAEAAVAAMPSLGIRGLSVTMPHKAAAAAACHQLSHVAERLGVVNTVSNRSGLLVGDSTDGAGFLDSLAEKGWSPRGKRCLVMGAGGAARAVVLALAEAGAARVTVVARRAEQADEVAALAGPVGAVGSIAAAGEAALVVNATPVGMEGIGPRDGRLPFGLDPTSLGQGQLVADLVYAPATTPFLAEARRAGAGTCNGLGMLIHQAARQVAIWTGRQAPIAAMSAAALRELGQRAEKGELGKLPQSGEFDLAGTPGEVER
jgi:shikimate dehydrogenase